MYPKFKVRTEGQGDRHAVLEYNWSPLLSLKDVPFLLLQDSYFPVKEYLDISPSPIARVPKSYVPKIILPTNIFFPEESASEVSDKKSNSDEEDRPKIRSDEKSNSDEVCRPHIRASSVPRPRAVLSSPVNDAVVGNKNRVKVLRPSALKNQNVAQSRHTLCKTVRDHATDDNGSPRLRKPTDTGDAKIDLKVKSASATLMLRRSVNPSKPSSVRI